MTNRETAYQKAFDMKKSALSRRTAEYDKKIEALAKECPEYTEISNKISALGANVALTALSGDREKLDRLSKEIALLQEKRNEIVATAGIGEIKYDCPLCLDTGYIGGKICDCVKMLARGFSLGLMSENLPLSESRFEDFKLDFYPEALGNSAPKKRMTAIFKLALDYANNFDPKRSENLLFMGGAGLGKTHLSLAIVGELLKRDYDVLYSSAYNLFSKMENEHFNLRQEESYDYAISCDLLVIDDLGSEFVSPYIQTLLYNIINTRLLASRPVIINTNLSMKEIESRYTARVSSRLLGHYNAKLFIGEDIRQMKAIRK